MNIYFIISNIIGLVACIASILMYQVKRKEKVIFIQIIYSILMIIQYLLLNAISAFVASFVALIRAILFYYYSKKQKHIPKIYIVVIIILLISIQIYTYQDIYSIIPMIIGVTFTLTLLLDDINKFRIICLILALLWIVYNLHVLAYMAMVSSILDIISIIFSFIKEKRH